MSRPRHEHLKVWRDAMRLVRRVYAVTNHYPAAEKAGLVSQMRRAAIGIPARIADATGAADPRKFLDALQQARGAVRELETLEVLSRQLHMVGPWRTWSLRHALRRYGLLLASEADTLAQSIEQAQVMQSAVPTFRFRRAA